MRALLAWLLARTAGPGGSGGAAERAAADWLRRRRGCRILARNWRNPADRREEIDLVCDDDGVLVFIEVKARAAGALVPGYHTVTPRKKRVLRRAIRAYLGGLRHRPRTVRFDIVEVRLGGAAEGPGDDGPVLHFENVPLFPRHFRG